MGAHHVLRQVVDGLAHTGRSCALCAMNRQKGFHHGHSNLGRFKWDNRAIAADDLVLLERRCRGGARGSRFVGLERYSVFHGRRNGLHVFDVPRVKKKMLWFLNGSAKAKCEKQGHTIYGVKTCGNTLGVVF